MRFALCGFALERPLVKSNRLIRHNVFDLVFGDVVHEGPVVLVHRAVLLHGPICVFSNMRLALLTLHVVIQLRVLLLHFRNLFDFVFTQALRARKLLHQSLHFPASIPLMYGLLGFEQVLELFPFGVLLLFFERKGVGG